MKKLKGTVDLSRPFKLETFGRIVGLSRQAIVNDDLSALADFSARVARAVAEHEATLRATRRRARR